MRVWYAAYGSNLSRQRFGIYLQGGRPVGADHTYPGCRDPSPPQADVAGEIRAELAFGGSSRTWGGGVAFVDRGVGATRARLYLVTLEQFADVVAQENWLEPGEVGFDEPPNGLVVLDGDHTYGVVIRLPDHDGAPVLAVSQPAGTEVAAPSAHYLRHIAAGLRESHAMSTEEVIAYLSSKRGVSGVLSVDDVAAAIS